MTARKSTTRRKPAPKRRPYKPPAKTKAGPGDVSLSITIDGELHRELVALAAGQDRTLAGEVRYGLRLHVERQRNGQPVREEPSS